METTYTEPVFGTDRRFNQGFGDESQNISVFGIFRSRESTINAVEQLKLAGFRNSDVSVLMPDKDTSKEFAHERHSKAPEGATTGVSAGMVLGGTLGWLAGIGALAIPGIGPLVAAGPILAALAGAGLGGAVGGVSGALIGFGIPEFEAKRYEGSVKNGGILMSVHCDSIEWVERAERLLRECGADDIAAGTEAKA